MATQKSVAEAAKATETKKETKKVTKPKPAPKEEVVQEKVVPEPTADEVMYEVVAGQLRITPTTVRIVLEAVEEYRNPSAKDEEEA